MLHSEILKNYPKTQKCLIDRPPIRSQQHWRTTNYFKIIEISVLSLCTYSIGKAMPNTPKYLATLHWIMVSLPRTREWTLWTERQEPSRPQQSRKTPDSTALQILSGEHLYFSSAPPLNDLIFSEENTRRKSTAQSIFQLGRIRPLLSVLIFVNLNFQNKMIERFTWKTTPAVWRSWSIYVFFQTGRSVFLEFDIGWNSWHAGRQELWKQLSECFRIGHIVSPKTKIHSKVAILTENIQFCTGILLYYFCPECCWYSCVLLIPGKNQWQRKMPNSFLVKI